MKYLYSLGGANAPVIKEFDITAGEKFRAGQVVRISTDGYISKDALGGCIGVAAEDHSGEKDLLNARNSGTKLRIDITKNAVYSVDAVKVTATGGSATTMTCDSDMPFGNLAGAKIVLVHKGENSENTDSVGTVRKVNNVSVSGMSSTFNVANGGKICEGDVYAIIPVYGFKGCVSDDGEGFAFASNDIVTYLYVVNYNTDTLTLEVMLKKDYIA